MCARAHTPMCTFVCFFLLLSPPVPSACASFSCSQDTVPCGKCPVPHWCPWHATSARHATPSPAFTAPPPVGVLPGQIYCLVCDCFSSPTPLPMAIAPSPITHSAYRRRCSFQCLCSPTTCSAHRLLSTNCAGRWYETLSWMRLGHPHPPTTRRGSRLRSCSAC